jgi:ABC-2 type transport system permease protein
MSTTVALPASSYRPARLTDTVRSEATKLSTIPSTTWALIATLIIGVGLSALLSAVTAHAWQIDTPRVRETWDPTAMSTSGGSIAQLALAVLGVLAVTSEYATGEIRSTLAATPHRGRVLAAKAAVVSLVAFVAGEIVMFTAYGIGQALIHGHAPTSSLSQPGVFRAVSGGGLYIIAIALLGVGFGTLLRGTAAAISTLVALLYVLPALAAALPGELGHAVQKYWPTQAGGQVTNVVHAAHTLGPWTGMADLTAFTMLVLAVAYWRLTRTDS